MWNDEDNNPYGSLERRDSDLNPPSPSYPYHQPQTPTSASEFPRSNRSATAHRSSNNDVDESDEESTQPRKTGYQSRVEQILSEDADLLITIVHAGKNQEGGGNYITYTIRTGDLEVRRRYSDFYSLRQTLVNLHPTLIVPPIPEKHSMADYAAKPTKAKEDEAIIDHRKRMLASFLNRCRKMQKIREDPTFAKFLDPHASWSEVLHSPPVSLLPKSNLKSPPLDATNPTPGHSFLPIPSSTAKLKSSKDSTATGTPTSPPEHMTQPSAAAHTSPGPQIFGKFPPPANNLPEHELDPYFVNYESSSRELEQLLQGSVEKVNKRIVSHLTAYSEDLLELGARLNGFSLSEQSSSLAAAIEKVGQAVDSTYVASGDLSSSLSAGFCEPMRESAQFAGVVRSVLRYRILKRVQEEMTKDELEKKKTLLEQLERSELEAKRIDTHLENSGFLPASPTARKGSSSASARSSNDSPRTDEDSASIDSDFRGGSQSAPSAVQGTPQQQSRVESPPAGAAARKNSTGSFMANKILGRINHAFQGIVDVDPERTRRDQIGKTRESIIQLSQAQEVSEKDVKDASSGVLKSLKEFQSEKEDDLRRYMIAFAKSHIVWAKKNIANWEEAKAEVEAIRVHE